MFIEPHYFFDIIYHFRGRTVLTQNFLNLGPDCTTIAFFAICFLFSSLFLLFYDFPASRTGAVTLFSLRRYKRVYIEEGRDDEGVTIQLRSSAVVNPHHVVKGARTVEGGRADLRNSYCAMPCSPFTPRYKQSV